MQQLRDEQVATALKHREILDKLEEEHEAQKRTLAERQRFEDEDYRKQLKEERNRRTTEQHDIEQRMSQLKQEWAREHPYNEIKVVGE